MRGWENITRSLAFNTSLYNQVGKSKSAVNLLKFDTILNLNRSNFLDFEQKIHSRRSQ